MTWFLRNVQALVKAQLRPRIKSLADEQVSVFRVLPTDLDQNLHMNNARYLNYFEAMRNELQVRAGFLALALKRRWMAPVRRIEVEYLRPLRALARFEVGIRVVRADEQDLVCYHEVRSDGKVCTRALVWIRVKEGRRTVGAAEYLPLLDLSAGEIAAPESVQAWLDRTTA